MKKRLLAILALSVVLVACLAGCSKNFDFKALGLTKDNVVQVSVSYENSKKVTEQADKISAVLQELDAVNVEEFDGDVSQNVFDDSVVGKIEFAIKDKEGKYQMVFAETTIDGKKISLLKCSRVDGLKDKKLVEGIFQMQDTAITSQLLIKIFANCI